MPPAAGVAGGQQGLLRKQVVQGWLTTNGPVGVEELGSPRARANHPTARFAAVPPPWEGGELFVYKMNCIFDPPPASRLLIPGLRPLISPVLYFRASAVDTWG